MARAPGRTRSSQRRSTEPATRGLRLQDHRRPPRAHRDHRPGRAPSPRSTSAWASTATATTSSPSAPPGPARPSTIYDFLDASRRPPCPAPTTGSTSTTSPSRTSPTPSACPPARPRQFRKDMEKLVEDLQAAITQAFEGEEYEKQKREIAQQVGEKQEAKLSALSQKAEAQGFIMVRTPAGLAFAPKTAEGETMSRETYEALPPEEQKRIDDGLEALNEELQQIMRLVRQDERGGRERLRELDHEVTTFAAKHLVDEACEHWCDVPEVVDYLHAVLDGRGRERRRLQEVRRGDPRDVHGHPHPPAAEGRRRLPQVPDQRAGGQLRPRQGAPVVTESNPVLQNLVGRVEHQAQFGALFTDFSMIKPGALHKANGGFLVLEARDVLTQALLLGCSQADAQDRRDPDRGHRPADGLRHHRHPRPGAHPLQGQDRADRRALHLLPALRPGPRLPGAVQGQGRLRHRGRPHPRERAALRPLHRPGLPAARACPPSPPTGSPA